MTNSNTPTPAPPAMGEPEPNWCTTCGKHRADPAAVFCSNAIHLNTTPQPQAASDADEDAYVIMALGRLLAEIAVVLKGPEPAGMAWSYHDLPDMVREVVATAGDISDEMTAWARLKMADRGSSRRDKMMIQEWAKRLIVGHKETFPVKDFEIPGLSLSKEEIRDAVRRVVNRRTYVGQDFGEVEQPQAAAGGVDLMVSVPRHYADVVGYAAVILESSSCLLDRNNAPALRNLLKLMTATPTQPGEREGFDRSALLELADRWDKDAARCDDEANRMVGALSVKNELHRDAAQHRQSAWQLRETMKASTAPVAEVGP